LVILDGWAQSQPIAGNAVALAKTPELDYLSRNYPFTKLHAHWALMSVARQPSGNSEAGHMNIGAGRLVEQDAVKNKSRYQRMEHFSKIPPLKMLFAP